MGLDEEYAAHEISSYDLGSTQEEHGLCVWRPAQRLVKRNYRCSCYVASRTDVKQEVPKVVWDLLVCMHSRPTACPVPEDWGRYVVLEPGYLITTTWLLGVSPDESQVRLYDHFRLQCCDVVKWVAAIVKCKNSSVFQAFIIDDSAGSHVPEGMSNRLCDLYWKELEQRHLLPVRTGPLGGFFPR